MDAGKQLMPACHATLMPQLSIPESAASKSSGILREDIASEEDINDDDEAMSNRGASAVTRL